MDLCGEEGCDRETERVRKNVRTEGKHGRTDGDAEGEQAGTEREKEAGCEGDRERGRE